jgi:hypothetical protein
MNSKKFYDSGDNYFVDLASTPTLTANRNIKFPDLAGTIALADATQTLTSKTLTTPIIDGVQYAANDRQIVVRAVAIDGNVVRLGTVTLWTAPANAIILRCILNITNQSTGVSTMDVGYTAVSAVTTSDTLLDGVDSGSAAAIYDSQDPLLDTSANAKAQLAASGKWITASQATGDTADLAATAYIFFILA